MPTWFIHGQSRHVFSPIPWPQSFGVHGIEHVELRDDLYDVKLLLGEPSR